MLRDDRHYGSMGGMGRIYYTALSRYAADHGIQGEGFGTFVTLVSAMDEEYLAVSGERAKEEAEKAKREGR